MDGRTFVTRWSSAPADPLLRVLSALTWPMAPRLLEGLSPPAGLEGFERPFERLTWVLLLVPLPLRTREWVSTDGRIRAECVRDKVILVSALADGGALVTWPRDATGARLAGRADGRRVSLVGSGDLARDVRRHAEALRELEAAGGEVVVFDDLASRAAASAIYTRHNGSRTTAAQALVVNLGGVLAAAGLGAWLALR